MAIAFSSVAAYDLPRHLPSPHAFWREPACFIRSLPGAHPRGKSRAPVSTLDYWVEFFSDKFGWVLGWGGVGPSNCPPSDIEYVLAMELPIEEDAQDVPYVLDVEIEMVPPGKLVFARSAGGCFWPAVQLEREAGPRHWQVHWLAKPNVWGKVSKDWTLPYKTHRDELVGVHIQERGKWGDWDAAIIMADNLLSKQKFRWEPKDGCTGIDLNLPAQEIVTDLPRNIRDSRVKLQEPPMQSICGLVEEFEEGRLLASVHSRDTHDQVSKVYPTAVVEDFGAQQELIRQGRRSEVGYQVPLEDCANAVESAQDTQKAKVGSTNGIEADEFWGCCSKCQSWTILQSDMTPCVCGEWIERPSSTQAMLDHWIRCDKCTKWRVVSREMLDRYEAAGSGATWTCKERHPGTSCDSECDWSVLRREVDKARKLKHLSMKQADARILESFKSKWSKKQILLNTVLSQPRLSHRQMKCFNGGCPHQAAEAVRSKIDEDFWFECESCKLWVQVKAGSRSEKCDCGKLIERPKTVKESERWIQCELCFKWRKIPHRYLDILQRSASNFSWTCQQLFRGANCCSIFGDWNSIQSSRKGSHSIGKDEGPLRTRRELVRKMSSAATKDEHWLRHDCTTGKHFTFIPGLHLVYSSETLANGLNVYDGNSCEFILATREVPSSLYSTIDPFMHAALEMFQDGKLPLICDGRAAAGPVDLVAFLQRPSIKEKVERALHRRRERLGLAGKRRCREQEVMHVVHVKPTGRSVYIGDEFDRTVNGTKIMEYNKMWQSNPIQSWSGGKKLQDMPGHKSPCVVTCRLSKLLAEVEQHLHQAAEILWQLMQDDPALSSAAEQMLNYYSGCSEGASCRLGRTGWNAYSFNVDFVTAIHLDSKNVPGSFSALLVFEVGAPYKGGHYCLPQYHKILDCRQGIVLFHRSGDSGIGLHANCELHRPSPTSHRVSLILYQTSVKTSSNVPHVVAPPSLHSDRELSPDLKRPCTGVPLSA